MKLSFKNKTKCAKNLRNQKGGKYFFIALHTVVIFVGLQHKLRPKIFNHKNYTILIILIVGVISFFLTGSISLVLEEVSLYGLTGCMTIYWTNSKIFDIFNSLIYKQKNPGFKI